MVAKRKATPESDWPDAAHTLISKLETPVREADFIAELLVQMLDNIKADEPLDLPLFSGGIF